MTHRATVERDSNLGAESTSWGSDPTPSWTTNLSDQPCYFWFEETRSNTAVSDETLVALTRRKVIFPAGTDVKETDRVLTIEDRLGNEIADGPMRIDSVGRRRGHIVCVLVEDR